MEEGSREVKRQLLLLKKELKCWENMFERKHGRKPAREDIDESPSEIKETYRQYHRLKVSQTPKGPLNDISTGDAIQSPGVNETDGSDEVFGCHLNKKTVPKKQMMYSAGSDDSGTDGNRGPMWKLRKWTKDSGYKTVLSGETTIAHDSSSTHTVEEEGKTNKQDDVTDSTARAEKESVDVDAELSALSQRISIKISNSPQKRSQSMDEVVNVVRHYRSGGSIPTPRLGHNLSSKWLQRCRPDLSSLSQVEEEGRHNETASKRDDNGVGALERQIVEEPQANPDSVNNKNCAMEDGGNCVDEVVDNEHFSSDSGEEEVETEDVLIEEEDGLMTEEDKGEDGEDDENMVEGEVSSSTEDEGADECGGWDGRLQDKEDSSEYLFDPATRHGMGIPAENHGPTHNRLSESRSTQFSEASSFSTSDKPTTTAQTTDSASINSESLLQSKGPIIKASSFDDPMITQATESIPNNSDPLWPIQSGSSTPSPSTSSTLGVLDKKESCVSVCKHVSASKKTWKLQDEKGSELAGRLCDLRPTRTKSRKGKEKMHETLHEVKSEDVDVTLPRSSILPRKDDEAQTVKTSSGVQKGSARDVGGDSSQSAVSPAFSSSAVSDNFVRLNLKVKRFSRKPGGMTGSAYKRKMWKKSQRGRSDSPRGGGRGGSGRNTCFKCGKSGHWAKDCTERVGSKNLGCFAGEKVHFSENMELDSGEVLDRESLRRLAEESPYPSTREAALMARGVSLKQSRQARSESKGEGGEQDSFRPLPPCRVNSPSPPPAVEPYFSPDQSDVHKVVTSALKKLGYQSFRVGQAETTTQILSGISTLLVQPTGSGKSLCYQLPAYLYSQRSLCITLVISPLVSLMEDQVRQFPPCLKGACLHTNQTQAQRQRVMTDVAEGRVDVLLLSPEALVSGAFWSSWNKRMSSQLPPVAFACIDEAHCVSEWSHNFRPSYLRVHMVLKERLGVQCVLGLTATATRTTALSVASHLSVSEENIIRGCTVPSNLHITASCDDNRDDALLQLLQSSRMRDCDSIIIYCTRQMETERVAQLLRTHLQFFATPDQQTPLPSGDVSSGDDDSSVVEAGRGRRKRARARASQGKRSKKAKLDWSVDSYHAGMSAGERKKIQLAFMTGRLRIVVATVAFGMGLNKSDVRAIIHYNIPKSFESYVQEIGRAGRDGKPAFCHVFIDKEGADLCELRRHAYSSTVDPYCIKQLVTKVFPTCHCKPAEQESRSTGMDVITGGPPKPLGSQDRWCAGHEVAVPIENTVQEFDAKEECIQTLLCYLELQQWLEMKGVKKDLCTLKCYGGSRQLRALAQKVPAVAAATARIQEKGISLDTQSSVSFSCIEVASSMGWESYILCSELRDLQFNDRQTSSKTSGSSVLVEFGDPSFHLLSPGDMSPEQLDYVCDYLQKRVKAQETLEVDKLHLLYSVLHSVAYNNIYESFAEGEKSSTQTRLMTLVNDYFEDKLDCSTAADRGISVVKLPSEIPAKLEAEIARDVHSLMSIHTDRNLSGRTVARIFHGISSPCFPAEVWAKERRFWRRHLNVDFNTLCQLATRASLQLLHRC